MNFIKAVAKTVSPWATGMSKVVTPILTKAVSWSDPLTVIVTLFILMIPIALIYLTFARVAITKTTQIEVKGKNILYVIAHPDDEAMFFQPSILELAQYNKLYLLCLSNGNAEGLGRTREKELEMSCKRLGFSEAPTVIDDPELQDGMDVNWAPGLVADYIVKHCNQKENLDGKKAKIDMIMTFDEHGVSSHPNHIAIYNGVSKLMNERMMSDVEVFTLSTVHILRKYIGFVDINICLMDEWIAYRFNFIEAYMTLAEHATQLVWFRKLFIVFSRYTYVNSFYRYIQPSSKSYSAADADGEGGHIAKKKVNID